MDVREFIVVILLGLFVGLAIGYYVGCHDSGDLLSSHYEKEIKRLQNWNDLLIKATIGQEKRR